MAKKKTTIKSRLPLLLTILLTLVLILGALTIHKSTEARSQAKLQKTNLTKLVTVDYFFKNGNTGFTIPGKNSYTAQKLCQTVDNALWVTRYNAEQNEMDNYECKPTTGSDTMDFNIEPHVGYVMGVSADTSHEISFEETPFVSNTITSDTLTGLHYRSFDKPFFAQDVCDYFAATGHPFQFILPIEETIDVYRCNDGLPHHNFEIKPYHSYWLDNFVIFDEPNGLDTKPSVPQLKVR